MDEMELESEQAMEVEIEAPMAQLLEEEDSEEEDDEVGIVEVDYTPSEKNYYESEEFLKL